MSSPLTTGNDIYPYFVWVEMWSTLNSFPWPDGPWQPVEWKGGGE